MICYMYRYILWREIDENVFENHISGGVKPSNSAYFEQYSKIKFGTRKGAFTLAEVLITLGIIGVVAALTLPSLIQKYQDQVLENQLKKMYTTILQGVQKAIADDGVSKFSDTELFQSCKDGEHMSNACSQMVKKYFNVAAVKTPESEYNNKTTKREYDANVIQVKYGEYIDGDFHKGREVLGYYRDKSKRRVYPFGGLTYVLADGSEFIYEAHQNYNYTYATFVLDTNGEKGPNTSGLDIFDLEVNDDGRCVNYYLEAIQKNNWKFPW